jgi:flagellar M-ring protein FliF
VNAFLQTIKNLGTMRLAAMGGVAVLLLGFFIFLMTQLSSQDMALLYSDLDMADSGEIAAQLEAMEVPYEVGGDGTNILVPAEEVDRLRLAMAQQGLPTGGSLGYEIFDQQDGFGTTNFIQNINRLRALEGELARTIATIDQVRQARVHLVLPERELFSRETREPTASVFLRLDRRGVGSEQILAIQHLVSAAVPQLEPDNISIVDDHGNLLAQGPGADDTQMGLANAEQARRDYERRLREQIEAMLSRSLGAGRVLVQVAADMDFDRVTVNSETYDPESQVPRSTQFVEETSTSSEGDGLDPVTVAGNLPEAEDLGAVGGAETGSRNETSVVRETTNYEISRTTESRVREGGVVRRLSVAVMVDGGYEPGADGEMAYVPRSQEEMDRIAALVRTAAGFDAGRGDTVEVVNMRFAGTEDLFPGTPETGLLGLTSEELMRIAEMAILAVVAVLVILLVVRPLLTRALDSNRGDSPAANDLDGLLTDQSGLQRALAGPSMTGGPGMAAAELATTEGGGHASTELDALIDIDQVEGRVRASSIKKVGEIVEKHPEEAVSILRSWLYQE